MYAVNDRMDALCPQCAYDVVRVERREALPHAESESYMCRCGRCGWRFRVFTPDPILVADAPSIA